MDDDLRDMGTTKQANTTLKPYPSLQHKFVIAFAIIFANIGAPRMKEKILLIDDDLYIGQIIKAILKSRDVCVHHVLNGREGLQMAGELQPNLVLLDVMLPGMDGLEVCCRLREFSDVPILMISANYHATDVETGLAAGADNYLKKPFSNHELLARIDSMLEHRKKGKLSHPQGV